MYQKNIIILKTYLKYFYFHRKAKIIHRTVDKWSEIQMENKKFRYIFCPSFHIFAYACTQNAVCIVIIISSPLISPCTVDPRGV